MLNKFMKGAGRASAPALSNGEAEKPLLEPATPWELEQQEKPISLKLIDAKVRLHRKLIEDLNLATLERTPREELRQQIGEIVAEYVKTDRILLNAQELENFAQEVFDELTGLGPLEPLLKNPSVSDILVNTHEKVYVERSGKLELVPVKFKDEAHILRIVNKIVGAVDGVWTKSQPMVDARLADGSRLTSRSGR